jgi:hypothetical protein
MKFRAVQNPPASVRAHLFYYDIPTHSKYPNPSSALWRLGVRVNLSVWMVPDINVPRLPLKEMQAAGAKVELVRFDERDGETILRLAKEALTREVMGLRDGLRLSIQLTEQKYEGVATQDEDGIKKAHGHGYRYVRQSKQFLDASKEAALAFDLLGDLQELFNGFRDVIVAEERTLYYLRDKAMGKAQKAPETVPEQPTLDVDLNPEVQS